VSSYRGHVGEHIGNFWNILKNLVGTLWELKGNIVRTHWEPRKHIAGTCDIPMFPSRVK
jgi:hypothetical protein